MHAEARQLGRRAGRACAAPDMTALIAHYSRVRRPAARPPDRPPRAPALAARATASGESRMGNLVADAQQRVDRRRRRVRDPRRRARRAAARATSPTAAPSSRSRSALARDDDDDRRADPRAAQAAVVRARAPRDPAAVGDGQLHVERRHRRRDHRRRPCATAADPVTDLRIAASRCRRAGATASRSTRRCARRGGSFSSSTTGTGAHRRPGGHRGARASTSRRR